MTENDAVVISSNGQLTLTSVSKNHEGEWRCQATNGSGSTEAKTKLKVTRGKGMYIHACVHTHIMCMQLIPYLVYYCYMTHFLFI